MKTNILLLISFLFSTALLKGEGYIYIPYVEDSCRWSYCQLYQVSMKDYKVDYSTYQLKGDTTINGLTYKKLYYSCSENYIAALREENRKVFIKENQQDECLLYDFNLQEGDYMEKNEMSYLITKIDTVQIGETQRKRFFFDGGYDIWIEGIGSLYHFYALQAFLLGYETESINYQKKGTAIIYQSEAWYFNGNECNTSALHKINPETVYPVFNLNSNQLEIHGLLNGSYLLELYEMGGKQLLSETINKGNSQLNTSNLISGIYIYRLLKNGNIVSSGSIIKYK
ncbi:MAG: T9SS type A sorting domain-containing protein [Dysgonamonadaceae bacterium]|jgi:hypothetical protein|nr:T9SS type A sorting domain-containing protein [Dysgonamonadaceae bacterium]